MSTHELPERPDLGQLRRRAKELLRAATAGDADAVERIRRRLGPDGTVTLSAAQLVVAREHGFASWPKLKAEVEARTMSLAERVDEFLTASVDGRTGRAARLLAGDPRIAGFDVYTAATLGETERVDELITRDQALATAPDRRRGWPPLMYVCHSSWHRIDRRTADGMTRIARTLLDAGASPDTNNGRSPADGYRSALYGAAGIANNPAITELLLQRGANPDDNESLYHSAYHAPDLACMRLLLRHGATVRGTNALGAMLDTGDADGVLLLLAAGADPADGMGGAVLPHAVKRHVSAPIIEALLAAGADPSDAGCHPLTPLRMAVLTGQSEVTALLLRHGAPDDSTAVDHLIGACFRADRAEAQRLLAGNPGLGGGLSEAEQGMAIVHAADHASVPAVRLMLDVGFAVNAHGEPHGGTALHHAAYGGRAELVRLLVERGADVEARDATWNMTALGWAIVASGRDVHAGPGADGVATVQILLDAGSPTDGVWTARTPPSDDVAALLTSRGLEPE